MQIRFTPVRLIILATVVLGVGGYFLVDWLIVTDVERVEAMVDRLARVAEMNEVEAAMPHLDASFRMGRLDRDAFRKWCVKTLTVLRVREVSIWETKVALDGPDGQSARAEVQTFVEMEDPPGFHRVDWELGFRRRGEDVWKLSSLRAFHPKDRREIPLESIPNWIP
ncbi:MAG TPA: hypothetical protein VMZ92_11825 [Planctomycetota bacterium]|nr:hypothetical protein [Planctomycetota bacterium]